MKIRSFVIAGLFCVLSLFAPMLELKGFCLFLCGIYFIQGIKTLHSE